MRTREEAIDAFGLPKEKLSLVQNSAILRINKLFQETVAEIYDLVPASADRTAAVRKLLESKLTCVQAITHEKAEDAQALNKDERAPHAEQAKKQQSNKKQA